VFVSRGYSFAKIITLPDTEVSNYKTGDWYWPPDGTMVLIKGSPLVYVMDQSVVRPITYFVFIQRKYSFARVISVTPDEFSHVPPPPDGYWMPPLDGTLVKSDLSPVVYVIQGRARHIVSYEAFVAHNYKFSNIQTLPQVELDIIALGDPILN
jgi:hypothetical protein